MDFKTISIPIMGMEGADESWKTRFHLANSEVGMIGGSATPRENVSQTIFASKKFVFVPTHHW